MKKISLIALLLCSTYLNAQDFTVSGIHYLITNSTLGAEEVKVYGNITGGNSCHTGSLTLPSTVSNGGITYSVTNIGENAFYNCSSLNSITLPNSVTTIGNSAFQNCSNMSSITIPNSLTSIGHWVFSDCNSLSSITLPNSITSIGNSTFQNCSSLSSVTLPNSVTSIGNSAFDGCNSLSSVTLPNSITSIGNSTFYNCSSLSSVTLPNSVINIGNAVFQNCSSLSSVTLSNSLTSIGTWAFQNCTNLGGIILPHSLTSISDFAFYNCTNLNSVTFPNSLTSIGSSTFQNCSSLNNVTFSNSLTTIGHSVFSGCNSLSNITLPNSLTSIGNSTFQNCSSLSSVTLPNSLTSIGTWTFAGCTSLSCFFIGVTTPISISLTVFVGVPLGLAALHVPLGSKNTYDTAAVWMNFGTVIEIDTSASNDTQAVCDSLTWIDGNTYYANNNTATYILTSSNGCDSLVTLDLTIGLTTGADVQTVCDSLIWIDGNTYYTSNSIAQHTIVGGAAAGCDSLVILNLTINANASTDLQAACSPYTWIDGNTYAISNNTAMHTLTNAAGCDSVVTLDLTINTSNTGTDLQTACDSLTWIDGTTYLESNSTATHTLMNVAGCDSVVTLNLTIISSSTSTDFQTVCNTYTWIDGNIYTASNSTATHTLINAAGCDSIVTLNLTIDTLNLDITVNNNQDSLTAHQAGANYQWIDCANGDTLIAGATNQLYQLTANGGYAVIVTNGICMDTSACYSINVGIAEFPKNSFSIHPNPVREVLSITSDEQLNNITIYAINGQVITSIANPNKKEVDVSHLSKGMHIIAVQTNQGMVQMKFVKE